MFFLINLSLILLFIFIFTSTYFLIQRFKSLEKIISQKFSQVISDILEGIFYGLIFLISQISFRAIYYLFFTQLFLVGFIIILIIRNSTIAIVSLIPGLLYFLLETTITSSTYLIIGSFFIIALFYQFTSFYTTSFLSKILILFFTFLLGISSFIISIFLLNNGFNQKTFSETFSPLLFLILIEILISYVIRVSISANILYESVNFDFSVYWREQLIKNVITDLVNKKSINKGIYGIFEIEFKKFEKNIFNREITQSVLLDIKQTFPRQTVFFKADEKRYGFFMKANNEINLLKTINENTKNIRGQSSFVDIQRYLDSVSTFHITSFDEKVKVNVFAGISIYGIQSYSINELYRNSIFSLLDNTQTSKNRYSIFDPQAYTSKLINNQKIKEMDSKLELDNFRVGYTPIYDIEKNKVIMNIAFPENISETEFIESIREYISNFQMEIIFDRYFATIAIEQLNKYDGKLAFVYSTKLLSIDFDFNRFVKAISRETLEFDKLIITIYENECLNEKQLILNFKKLGTLGFKTAIISSNKNLKNNYKNVDYVFVNSNYVTHNKNINFVAFDLNNEKDLFQVFNNKITMVGGKIFEINNIPNNFNKQSKIYIEKILKERKKNVK